MDRRQHHVVEYNGERPTDVRSRKFAVDGRLWVIRPSTSFLAAGTLSRTVMLNGTHSATAGTTPEMNKDNRQPSLPPGRGFFALRALANAPTFPGHWHIGCVIGAGASLGRRAA